MDKPTREKNTLDLIYTTKAEEVSQFEIQIVKPISDHNLVQCKLNCIDKETKGNKETVEQKDTQYLPSTLKQQMTKML